MRSRVLKCGPNFVCQVNNEIKKKKEKGRQSDILPKLRFEKEKKKKRQEKGSWV